MSPEYWVLKAEMDANGRIDPDAIIAHVTRTLEYQPEPDAANPPRCYWCEVPLPTPQDAFLDDLWYCSEACRDSHIESK